jgi:hypothetical protein
MRYVKMKNPLTKTEKICSVKLKNPSVKMEYPHCKNGKSAQ